MPNITVVWSVHREKGLCNAGELLAILRILEPEVVFEEMRPSDFDAYYKHRTKATLESQAITRLRAMKSFQQVPVDRYDVPETQLVEIKRGLDSVFDRVGEVSQEYRQLNEALHVGAHQRGFKYLNSLAFETTMARISEIEASAILATGDRGLISGLEWWRRAIQERESAMVDNIYQYCGRNAFKTGVFVVGAAHRTGIVKEIEKRVGKEAALIVWDLAYGDQVP